MIAAAGVLLLAGLSAAVDPFIGTGGHGHTYPGATVPFGMVQLSPDTRLSGWDGCSGYHADDSTVYGFSHTHLSGTGVSDYGDVLFVPAIGDNPPLVNGTAGGEGYAQSFEHRNERAGAGWYEVVLEESGVFVELTAAERAGMHRYTFPTDRPASVIVDLGHRDRLLDNTLRVVSDHEIAGMRRSTAWAKDQVVYFHARFDAPIRSYRIVGRKAAGVDSSVEPVVGLFRFGNLDRPLEVAVGLSAVDADGARDNLEDSIGEQRFDAVRAAAIEKWRRQIDRFQVQGASPEQRTVFATALYHGFLAPNLFSDADGRYRGLDGQIHVARNRRQYTVFSLWDTFRATHPFFTLVERARTAEFAQTLLAIDEQSGRLPVWELAGNETDCMIGYHSVSVLADAWREGIRGFDAERALDAMVRSARHAPYGMDDYERDGYLAADRTSESVSKTLEYAYDDWCIARMADSLGHQSLAAEFDRRSQAWRHLFDPNTRFLRPRENGGWMRPYDPRRVDFHHTEANGWQYRFAVPHDIESLIEAFGGDGAFVAALDSLFEIDTTTTGRDQADITGRIGQYAHGNEPSHHVAWLYHFAGHPDRSAARVRTILNDFYRAAPDGLIGNEDCGQMSSWYVLAATGIYPVVPGSGEWCLVPPLFERVVWNLEGGARFVVRREGEGVIQRAWLNDQPLTRSYLREEEILSGGELLLQCGPQPSTWGRETTARPHSRVPGPPVVAAPWAEAPADRFRESMDVRLHAADPQAVIHWTKEDGGDLSGWPVARGPIHLEDSTTLRFVARLGDRQSPVSEARFWRLPHDWRVRLDCHPNAQYTAGGADALVDGQRGSRDWRIGRWIGVQGEDFVATVDLGRPERIEEVALGLLQDTRSWIVLPTALELELSVDGEHFESAGRVSHDVPIGSEDVSLHELRLMVPRTRARFVRLRAHNAGPLPAWHPGAGGESFVFADEIRIETSPRP